MTFSYLNTLRYWCYLDNWWYFLIHSVCQVCNTAATSTVMYSTDAGSGTYLLSGDKNADQKCLKFWHLICWSPKKTAKQLKLKSVFWNMTTCLWTVQWTEIVFQQKEKMESSRSNPDVWPCYSVFMCHHTTTSQTLQITPDISHPPGDLKKV